MCVLSRVSAKSRYRTITCAPLQRSKRSQQSRAVPEGPVQKRCRGFSRPREAFRFAGRMSGTADFQKFNLEEMGPAPGRFELSKGILE